MDLLCADDERFAELAAGSPVHRATRVGLARSAALVLGHVADPSAVPALARAAAEDPSPAVRDAAAWALSRLSTERA